MKKVLLVIDMLNDFIRKDGALPCGAAGEKIVPFVKEKIAEFRKCGDDVIFICDRHEIDDKEFNRFPKHCVEGTKGAEIIDELKFDGYEKNITGKQRYSGFYGTDLEEQLEIYGEAHLVGVCTNICVFFTAEELCNRDIKTIVYKDGVASFDAAAHEYALKEMASVLGAEVR
jgi:nicotinamidase/pyrazinamidase